MRHAFGVKNMCSSDASSSPGSMVNSWPDCKKSESIALSISPTISPSVCPSDDNILVNLCVKILKLAFQSGLTVFSGNLLKLSRDENCTLFWWFVVFHKVQYSLSLDYLSWFWCYYVHVYRFILVLLCTCMCLFLYLLKKIKFYLFSILRYILVLICLLNVISNKSDWNDSSLVC